MSPNQPNHSSEEVAARTEAALDEALTQTFPASDAINLRQWNEIEAIEKARVAREERMRNAVRIDRAAQYSRGPTAFSA